MNDKSYKMLMKADQSIRKAFSDVCDVEYYLSTIDHKKSEFNRIVKYEKQLSKIIEDLKYNFKR